MVDGWRAWLAVGLLGLAAHARAEVPIAGDTRAEAKLLATLAPAVERRGLQLALKATNGRTVHFDSVHPGDANPAAYVDHRLVGTSPDGKFFVVHSLSHEAETLFWVSRATGGKTEVFAAPAVSPDGRFVVTALHWEAFGPGGVFVWEIVGDDLVQRGHIRHGDYGLFTFQRWTANDKAELKLYSHSHLQSCPGSQATTATVSLERGRRGWAIAAPAPHQVRCE